METIKYIKGDATNPQLEPGLNVIVHCCNDLNGFGKGFAFAVKEKWHFVKDAYHAAMTGQRSVKFKGMPSHSIEMESEKNKQTLSLGDIQIVPVIENELIICNLIGQQGYARHHYKDEKKNVGENFKKIKYVKYDAIQAGLEKIKNFALEKNENVTFHMPKMGSGLAGGDWSIIEAIVKSELQGLKVIVYEFDE